MIFVTNDSIIELSDWKFEKGKISSASNSDMKIPLKSMDVIKNETGRGDFESIIDVLCNEMKEHSAYIDLRKYQNYSN